MPAMIFFAAYKSWASTLKGVDRWGLAAENGAAENGAQWMAFRWLILTTSVCVEFWGYTLW